MNVYADQLCQGLRLLEDGIGATMTWAGTPYPCIAGAHFRGKAIDVGGLKLTADNTIVVRASLFAAGRPQEKQSVSYKATPEAAAVNFTINRIGSLFNEILILECS